MKYPTLTKKFTPLTDAQCIWEALAINARNTEVAIQNFCVLFDFDNHMIGALHTIRMFKGTWRI